jgi:phage shock protein PspC (stress-responsive transcriptional regulator)
MLLMDSSALGQTLALLATFIGIGILVNLLIVYIVAQVLVERRQNPERQQGLEG